MSSSLHVSVPDEMRAFVDLRTTGNQAYATPSEYVRALIRHDMERESERLYVFRELFKSMGEIKRGELRSAEQVEVELDSLFSDWEKNELSSRA